MFPGTYKQTLEPEPIASLPLYMGIFEVPLDLFLNKVIEPVQLVVGVGELLLVFELCIGFTLTLFHTLLPMSLF